MDLEDLDVAADTAAPDLLAALADAQADALDLELAEGRG